MGVIPEVYAFEELQRRRASSAPAHDEDHYCNPAGGDLAGIQLSGKACQEWTQGYSDGINATCNSNMQSECARSASLTHATNSTNSNHIIPPCYLGNGTQIGRCFP
jgi:hypothetical protein